MGRPKTLLEDLCRHALACGADAIEVESQDGREWVYGRKDNSRITFAKFPSSGADGKELRANLHAAHKKPVRTVLDGRLRILRVRTREGAGEDSFEVKIEAAPKLDPTVAPRFTKTQGQYLAFIYNYTRIHSRAPAEADLERYFQVSPPSIHEMIKTLERNGLIARTPGQARSIRLLIQPEHIPLLA